MTDAKRAGQRFQEKGTPLDANAGFHRAAEALRGPYLDYIYRIGEELDSLRWWISSISCRSGVTSKSFQQVCYLKAALDLMGAWSGPNDLVLVLDKTALLALAQNLDSATKKETKVLGLPGPPPFQSVSGVLKMVAHRAYFIIRESYRVLQCRRLMDRPTLNREPATIIFCWATQDNIKQNGEFHQAFYGDLADELERRGCRVAFVPIIWKELKYSEALSSLRQGSRPLLVPHRYLGWLDLFRTVLATVAKPPLPKQLPYFEGMNIRPVLEADRREHWISNAAADALITRALVRKWADLGFAIDRFIYVFENQPYERALCWQAQRSFPKADVVGYQHGRAPWMAINMYQAPGGEKAAPQPDWIVTVGKHTASLLTKNGNEPHRVVAGGALQMGDFFRLRSEGVNTALRQEGPTVLVAASSRLEEAAELVDAAVQLFSPDEGVRVVLKCHPVMPYEAFSFLIKQPLPEHAQLSDEPIHELMLKSSVMVYTSSATSVQALALGLPTVHLRSQFDFDMDPLDSVPDARPEATDMPELREKVRWMLKHRDEYVAQHQEAWDRVVDEMYGPVTQDTYQAFLDPAQNIAAVQCVKTAG